MKIVIFSVCLFFLNSVHLLAQSPGLDSGKGALLNSSGSTVNPATEDKQDINITFNTIIATLLSTWDFAVDSAASFGAHGIMSLTVRRDTAAALGGTDGDYQPIITSPKGEIYTLDSGLLLEVARGNRPGWKMYSIPGRKDSVSQSVLDDLSEIPATTSVPDPGGIQMEIVSSSANDDDDGGTGTRSIMVVYLDTSGAEQTEIVLTSGTTPVDTVAVDMEKIQWIHTMTVGSGGVSAGNISLRDTSGATTYAYITAGGNQSLIGKYTVPTGKTGYILGWQASSISQKIDIRLRATVMRVDRSLLPGIFLFQDIAILNNAASGWIPFNVPLKCPAGAQIKISGKASAANGDAGGQFDILLIDD